VGNTWGGFDCAGLIRPDNIVAAVRTATTHELLLIRKHAAAPISLLLFSSETQPSLLIAVQLQRHLWFDVRPETIGAESAPYCVLADESATRAQRSSGPARGSALLPTHQTPNLPHCQRRHETWSPSTSLVLQRGIGSEAAHPQQYSLAVVSCLLHDSFEWFALQVQPHKLCALLRREAGHRRTESRAQNAESER
jgi:hypothetical protein